MQVNSKNCKYIYQYDLHLETIVSEILVIHGPNLNLLGAREPHHYGTLTLGQIDERLNELADESGYTLTARQSNAEHEIVEFIQQAIEQNVRFIIINPAAYTHTSVAIRDALLASGIPCIEVHLSNIFQREEFRHRSYFSDIAMGIISGLGAQGYDLAVQAALEYLNEKNSED